MGTGAPPSHRRRIQLAQIPIVFVVVGRRSALTTTSLLRLAYENLLCAVQDTSLHPSKLHRRRNLGHLKERKALRTLRNAA